jgi:hypothetical protein
VEYSSDSALARQYGAGQDAVTAPDFWKVLDVVEACAAQAPAKVRDHS